MSQNQKYIIMQVEETEFYEMKNILQNAEQAITLSSYFMNVIEVMHQAIKDGDTLSIAADEAILINGKTVDRLIEEKNYVYT